MAAVELYKQDGKKAGVFFCSECRTVFATEYGATACHGDIFCACGEKIKERFRSVCSACSSKAWRAEEAQREAKRFEDAAKVKEAEYSGDMVSDGDRFYDSVEEAIDQDVEGQEPEYLWGVKDVGLPMVNSDNIVDHLLENMWEDAGRDDLVGLDELDAAIAQFNQANKAVRVYVVDYGIAVLLSKREASAQ